MAETGTVLLQVLYAAGMAKSVIAVTNMTMTRYRGLSTKGGLALAWTGCLAAGHLLAQAGWTGGGPAGRALAGVWYGVFIALALLFIREFVRGIVHPQKTVPQVQSRDLTGTLRPVPTPGLITAPYPWLRNQQFFPRFGEQTVWFEDLPREFDGFRFIHLSDLHYVSEFSRTFYLPLLDWIRQLRTRTVLMTGDFVTRESDIPGCVRWFGRLTSFSRVIGVVGNHDYWTRVSLLLRGMKRAGVRMLLNEAATLRRGKSSIRIIGLDDLTRKHEPPRDLFDPRSFQIVMAHNPDHLRLASRRGVDLQISGHTHAGQIRFPLLGSMFVPSRYGRRYDHGFFRIGKMVLAVTAGIGGLPPLRLRCRPEVSRFVLRRGVRP